MAHIDITVRLPPVTHSAPHVRDGMNVRMAMNVFLISLIPPTAVAIYNTGYQANLAMARLGVDTAPGWRGQIIDLLGTGYDPSAPWAAVVHGAVYFLPVFLAVGLVGAVWAWLFAAARGQPGGPGVLGIALVVTLMLPPTIPIWLAALGMSFGIVLGREIFGGFGRNILSPAVVALGFLHVTYQVEMMGDWVWVPVTGYVGGTPLDLAQQGGSAALAEAGSTWADSFLGIVPGTFGDTSTLACAVGAVLLLWMGLISWRVVAGILLGAVAAAVVFGVGSDGNASISALPWAWHLVLGSFAFGAVYLATDPVTAAATDTGRWIYGALIGVLAITFRAASPVHADGMVFAVLLSSIFAPAIDYAVMWANMRRRVLRNAR